MTHDHFRLRIAHFAIALGALVFAFAPSAQAQTALPGDVIRDFSSAAVLQQDRTLTVTETIAYDFGANPGHGIFRKIPTAYRRSGGSYKLRLELLSVKMDGASVPYSIESRSPDFVVKIGDPEKTVTGVHAFEIAYRTDRAINFFSGEGELYWNVTGNGWEVPISHATFSLVGPSGFDAVAASKICYTGPAGSTAQSCGTQAQANTAQFETIGGLGAGDGLTAAIRFPKGIIAAPTFAEQVWMLVSDNWVLFVPVLVFAFMLWYWRGHGRDPKGRGTVIPQYEPPRGLAPIEMSALMRQEIGTSAITATIIDLARRGYLKIEFGETKKLIGSSASYTFHVLKDLEETAPLFEQSIYDGIASKGTAVTLESLKGSFYQAITKTKERTFRSLREKGLFGPNPYAVRAGWFGGAAVFVFFGIWAGAILGGLATAALLVSAAIVAGFGWFMPTKTKEGAIALEEIEGFKWFLSVTETDRLKFTDAPALKPEKFHEFLPAAIAFGVEEQWTKQFAGLDIPEPTYASGYGVWNPIIFTHSLNSFGAAAAATAYVPPQSAGAGQSGFGGGGFSGGGFGGGGGGRW
jgi:uncharacterized membrane protein